MDYPKSVDEIITQKEKPAVAIDDHGFITWINENFTKAYGWTSQDIVGKSVTSIMPEKYRELHQIGFSRFLTTEQSKLAGKPLPLEVLFKDGTVKSAEHFILAEKKDGRWRLAATIALR